MENIRFGCQLAVIDELVGFGNLLGLRLTELIFSVELSEKPLDGAQETDDYHRLLVVVVAFFVPET